MKDLPNVVFFGSDAICLPCLNFLKEEGEDYCRLAAVISQPDRPQGRGRKLRANPVAEWASAQGVELWQPEKPDGELLQLVKDLQVVVGFVMAYGHFLPRSLRDAPLHGLVNFHGSILPAYRGASPVETALAEGESGTGVSLMQVVREMDAGGVADVEEVCIEEADTAVTLREKVGEAVVPLMRRNLPAVLSGGLEFKPQDASGVTHCRKITKEDGAMDFLLTAQALSARLRAFTPWPGGFFGYKGERIKVGRCSFEERDAGVPPGTIISADENSCLRIACNGGVLVLHELQRPGGRMLPAGDFLRGYPLEVGFRLESVAATRLVT